MKILGISGSPRGGESQTLGLVIAVLKGAEASGAKTELVDVCKLDIEYCDACGICFAEGTCKYEDDFKDLYQKILDCDGLVLGSPVYFRTITAQLKTMIDRMADAIHCQLLSGKYGCAVSTAGSWGHEELVYYLNGILMALGANVVGGAGAAMADGPKAMEGAGKDAFSLGEELAKAILTKREYPEQEASHREMCEHFVELVKRNKDIWTHEYEYWADKGLIEK